MLKVLEFRFQTLIFHFQKRVQICDIFNKNLRLIILLNIKLKKMLHVHTKVYYVVGVNETMNERLRRAKDDEKYGQKMIRKEREC